MTTPHNEANMATAGAYDTLLTGRLEELQQEYPGLSPTSFQIQLVKALRDNTDLSLVEAVDTVDEYYRSRGYAARSLRARPHPVAMIAGCALMPLTLPPLLFRAAVHWARRAATRNGNDSRS